MCFEIYKTCICYWFDFEIHVDPRVLVRSNIAPVPFLRLSRNINVYTVLKGIPYTKLGASANLNLYNLCLKRGFG